MSNIVEIKNIEIFELCTLNIQTKEMIFHKKCTDYKKIRGFYFKDESTFFALYALGHRLIMYYEGKGYPLHKNLHINLAIKEPWRTFSIVEYDIYIKYRTSKYLGFDVWSEEEDVDLFYRIQKYYQDDDFYKKYTISD